MSILSIVYRSFLVLLLSFSLLVQAHDDEPTHADHSAEDHAEDSAHHQHADEEDEAIQITPAMARQSGITTAVATAGDVSMTSHAYGRLQILPDRRSVVRARFPGVVTQVNVQLGDTVQKGAELARIESNDSLQTYTLRAAIDGVLVQRDINAGELADGQPLFVIVAQDKLLAELRIFPFQRAAVGTGQPVSITTDNASQQGTISHLLPSTDGSNQLVAHVVINNDDAVFTAGDLIRAEITTSKVPVAVRVDKRAVQTVENATVVFVQHEENHYEPRKVTIGRSDAQFAEIVDGLAAGDVYVAGNSYLLKAELEKSGAEHSH